MFVSNPKYERLYLEIAQGQFNASRYFSNLRRYSNCLTVCRNMPPRALARHLSEAPTGLQTWQQLCRAQIHAIYEDSFNNRVPSLKAIQELPWPTSLTTAKDTFISLVKVAHGCNEADALQWVDANWSSLEGVANQQTLRNTNVYCWRFDDASFWRGQPDTTKVCALAKSFIYVGFKKDSPICSRDNALTGFSCLRFGDGQARGLALRLAWTVLQKNIQSGAITHSASLQVVFDSLSSIPTCFEETSDETTTLVRQAVRQNVKAAMTVPVNSLEWSTIIMTIAASSSGITPTDLLSAASGNARKANAQRMLDVMGSVTSAYDAQVDDEGIVMGPVAKRPRRGRRSSKSSLDTGLATSSPLDDQAQSQIKIGTQKLAAIKNVLSHATDKSFKLMTTHSVWAGDFRSSGLSDAMHAHKHMWPGSVPNPTMLPTAGQLQINLASQKSSEMMVPARLTTALLYYEAELTYEMHESLVYKVLVFFEDEALHIADPSRRARFRPSIENLDGCRVVIQHWHQSIKECAQKDLSPEDFKELEDAVLNENAMDSQIIKALERFPLRWNMAMLPDLKAGMPDEVQLESETLLEQAELKLWNAKFEDFAAKLTSDQHKIHTLRLGSAALDDQLEWIRHMKMMSQASTVSQLVDQFTQVFVVVSG